MVKVFPKYYEFYGLDLINYFQETKEIMLILKKIRILVPKYPFYNCNIRQLIIIKVLYTILLKYIM